MSDQMPKGDWAEHLKAAMSREVTPRRAALRRAGEATRALIDRIVATRAPEEALVEAAKDVEAAVEKLSRYPQGWLYEGFRESANAGDPHAFFDNSPIIGAANPLAPPVQISVQNELVVGRARFGSAYEGPPGCVHGGYVAAAFDEVLGMAQSLTGRPGMTGRLSITYRRPTPLHTDVRFEGRVEKVEGRKIFTKGECYRDDELLCEAEALFISVDFDKIAELYDQRPSG
ncbi:MAG TPA: PaaI family thioesterase [Acidimicrobiales bacterium]|nr:PaaI family thioesterase [Acidimicrobiales bacterium]